MKKKPIHDGYCAFDPDGELVWKIIFGSAKQAWDHFRNCGDEVYYLRKEGYTVAKVKIVRVE